MRRLPVLTFGFLLGAPAIAHASPYAIASFHGQDDPLLESDVESDGVDDMGAPTEEAIGESEPAESTAEKKSARKGEFNKHGVGVRAGLVVIPTWILSPFLASHTNALCRGDKIGDFGQTRGLSRQDGCNFYVGGEYTYRYSRILDIVGTVGYQSIKAPEGYWLDADEWQSSCTQDDNTNGSCNLAASDYTEVDLGMVFIAADFVARAPVVVTEWIELGIGGGGGIGLGIVTGAIHQTPIGAFPGGYNATNPATALDTCNTVEDLSDFSRCTPRYFDAEETDVGGDGVPPALGELSLPPDQNSPMRPWAQCGADSCNEDDLQAFGYRIKQEDVPPVIPVVNLILSVRMIIKDIVGVTLNGGWNTGFYFGASMQYFFGKDIGKKKKDDTSFFTRKREQTARRVQSAPSSLRF